ncbi:protein of unknown function [Tessaracoccus bendigoensis DSM 12906]|uniref:Bacteriocin-protection, YdeI or OmpD-Associated n=1 Tax=Tessaracoccus bendigoensis DSM 12906 TaxID=1123357 RepID=A0A1M6MPA0_9ACTN|nr:YdeI/OmpD-associated family protein [Tessaracoccus bendigoensis]SHJ85226.1 protein of unknown function [Tessaracoccus bendigoensis DSM 12906]
MSQTSIRFSATPQKVGDRTILTLPDDASAALPSRGQVAVAGTINSVAFETVVEPDGRRGHWLSIGDELLGLLADDLNEAEVEFSPVGSWPEPSVPEDLQVALAEAPDIAETWNDITPMARWEWVRWVNATANPATRERRVEVSISKLRGGKRRPCCFDLSSCTDPEVSKSGKLNLPMP